MSRRYLRPGVVAGHLLVLIAALVCLRLGWWQWNVAHETRGTIQNLGYALLWPVFGGAFIFMWLRFLYLEGERRTQQTEPETHLAATTGSDAEIDAGSAPVTQADGVGGGPSDPGPEPAADAEPADSSESHENRDSEPDDHRGEGSRRGRRPAVPCTSVTIAVATVGGDDEDDPELAAYNEALARLAEQDRRRAT